MQFGQRNPKTTREDLMEAIPSRNTVKDAVSEIADSKRKIVTNILKRAITAGTGGVAVTTDLWTDDFRHESYMTVVAHVCTWQNNEIDFKEYILSTREVTETIKTGKFNF